MLQRFTLCIKETEYVPARNAGIDGFASLERFNVLLPYRASTEFSSFVCYHILLYATAVA